MIWLALVTLSVVTASIALFNALSWRRGAAKRRTPARVSVLIPARNEEECIERALASVLKNKPEFVHEVIVYDDKSTDATRRIVQGMQRDESRIRLLRGLSLPAGWIGKPHACSQLAEAARGDVLLFMDADVELEPDGISRLLSLTESPADGRVVTAMPRQKSGTLFERLVIPLLPLTYLAWLPLRLVEYGTDTRTVAANGQLLMVRRSDLAALGGFESVKDQIVDDVAFCKHAKRNAFKVIFADGTKMASCRMYRGAKETVDGFSKNLHEGVGGTPALLASVALYFLAFLAPYFVVLASLLHQDPSPQHITAAAAGLASLGLLLSILVFRYRQPPLLFLLFPLSIFLFAAIAFNSWRWQRLGKITWAGRTYASAEARSQVSQQLITLPSADLGKPALERNLT